MAAVRLPNLNRVYLIGRLTRDPEVKQTQSGRSVLNARMAVNLAYRDNEGNWQEDVTFVNLVAWRRLADICGEFLHKGSPVLVEGRLRSRSWEDQAGKNRHVVEVQADRVQFLDKPETTNKEIELETVEEEG
jgi:single-strand DNA-binding protein